MAAPGIGWWGGQMGRLAHTVKHTGQQSGGKLCETFKFWSFLQSKAANNVCKLLQLLGDDPLLGLCPWTRWAIAPNETAWRAPPLTIMHVLGRRMPRGATAFRGRQTQPNLLGLNAQNLFPPLPQPPFVSSSSPLRQEVTANSNYEVWAALGTFPGEARGGTLVAKSFCPGRKNSNWGEWRSPIRLSGKRFIRRNDRKAIWGKVWEPSCPKRRWASDEKCVWITWYYIISLLSCDVEFLADVMDFETKFKTNMVVRLSSLKCLFTVFHFFRRAIFTWKICQIDLLLACNQCSLVGLCTQDYKSPRFAALHLMVNIQTDRHTDSILTRLHIWSSASPADLKSVCKRW